MTSELGPLTLQGRFVTLEPLRPAHLPELLPALEDREIWRWIAIRMEGAADLESLVAELIESERAGKAFGFAVIDAEHGRAVGSTRYLDVDEANRSVEIGGTWYMRSCWGTRVNPEAKLLLLRHAFEDWGAVRVYLKTDVMNTRSRAAIERLGAVREGILRNHMIRSDGTLRDSVFYSILPQEWPAVRRRLENRLTQAPPATLDNPATRDRSATRDN